MHTELPWHFPDERARLREETRRFQQLSFSERLERIFDLIAIGQSFLASSPTREAARRLRERDEEEWRQRFRELFARYEARTGRTAARTEDGPA